MLETLLGGVLGGVLRLVPEILRLLDRKHERQHELELLKLKTELSKVESLTESFVESVKGQSHLTGVKWVDALSASVRPVITYWVMLLFCMFKMAGFIQLLNSGWDITVAIQSLWTEADQALLAAVVNFWFVSRVFDKSK